MTIHEEAASTGTSSPGAPPARSPFGVPSTRTSSHTRSSSTGMRPAEDSTAPPRLGFLGLGWIGRHRMEAVAGSGAAEVAALVDTDPGLDLLALARDTKARICPHYEAMLDAGLDGIVIATPSAGHAAQAIAALQRGLAVFCQKPLGRTADEVRAVVRVAERADRLLGVDFSYRHLEGARILRNLVRSGELGDVYAVELVFHNAYGPDKEWFYDPGRSGGGCVMDLGVHLVDLLLWVLDFPRVNGLSARLYAEGVPLRRTRGKVEDFAEVVVDLEPDRTATLACSWNLHAGWDAEIRLVVHGTNGSARISNVEGSFYDFVAERAQGTTSEVLAGPPDEWGPRAVVSWAERLRHEGPSFDAGCRRFVTVARVLDAIYRSELRRPERRAASGGRRG